MKQARRDRHGPVALAVGDPVGVGAVAGDRVADPVPDPPGRPGAERGEPERDDGDGDAARRGRPEPCASSQPSAPDPQPVARGRRARRASARNQPTTPSARQTTSVRRPRRRAAEQRDGHERAAVAQVALASARRSAVADVGEQRGHGPAIIARGRGAGSGRTRRIGTPWRARSSRSYRGSGHDGARRVRPFYKDVRDRLLLQTYCAHWRPPGLPAAVRDAFVVAWHHWRKVSRLEDPEAWVRPHAWRHAQRRHTARLWHREKDLDPEVKATLDALGQAALTQRRVLLLTQLTSGSLAEMAREVGLPARRGRARAADRDRAVRAAPRGRHDRASAASSRRSRAPPSTPAGRGRRSSAARAPPAGVRTPSSGVVATVAALVVTGTLVTDAAGVRPTPRPREPPGSRPSGRPGRRPRSPLPGGRAAHRRQLDATLPATAPGPSGTHRRQHRGRRHDVMPCQPSRYADPARRRARWSASSTRHRRRAASHGASRPTEASRDRAPRRRTLRHRRRLVRRLPRRAGPAARRPARSTASATRRPARAARLEQPGDDHLAGVARTGAVHHDHRRPAGRAGRRSPTRRVRRAARRGRRPASATCPRAARARRPARSWRPPAGPGRPGPGMLDRGRPAAGRRRRASPGSAPSPAGATTTPPRRRCDNADFTGKSGAESPDLHPHVPGPARPSCRASSGSPRRSGRCRASRRRRSSTRSAPSSALLRGRRPRHRGDHGCASRRRRPRLTVWRVTTEVTDERSVTS